MDPETDQLDGHRSAAIGPVIIHTSSPGCRLIAARHRCKGFTLLEVLVVTAIVALLVAIVLPSIAAARRESRQLLCQTNLRTIAQGWHTYLAETKGKFLKSGPGLDNVQSNFGGRQGQISGYQGRKPLNRVLGWPPVTRTGAKAFHCPLDFGTGRARPTYFDYRGNSYQMNNLLVGPQGPPGLQLRPGDPPALAEVFERVAALDLAEITTASQLLLVGDLGWYNAWEASFTAEDEVNWHAPTGRHNIAFMDGHVNLVKIEKKKWVSAAYTLIPFKDLAAAIAQVQRDSSK